LNSYAVSHIYNFEILEIVLSITRISIFWWFWQPWQASGFNLKINARRWSFLLGWVAKSSTISRAKICRHQCKKVDKCLIHLRKSSRQLTQLKQQKDGHFLIVRFDCIQIQMCYNQNYVCRVLLIWIDGNFFNEFMIIS